METIIIISSIVGGGMIAGLAGLTVFAKYIGDIVKVENEEKMNRICNKWADNIEADNAKTVSEKIQTI